jgi:hypothetical protein
MRTEDFARFLSKLDRLKANRGARNRNSPVWTLINPADTATDITETLTVSIIDMARAKWDGSFHWNGERPWGNG